MLYQVPDGSIVPSATSSQLPILDFESISSFVIPRQGFCDRLVSVCTNHYRVVGHPICIDSARYDRNQLIFNLAIVLEEDDDPSSYITVVRKLATLFRNLEEQGEFLSRDLEERQAGRSRGKVYALCEIILEDLNNYCECMIPIGMLLSSSLSLLLLASSLAWPARVTRGTGLSQGVDESNTINIKLFPLYPPPPPVKAWHVPLLTVRLESLMDENWDLTMQRVSTCIAHLCPLHSVGSTHEDDGGLKSKLADHPLHRWYQLRPLHRRICRCRLPPGQEMHRAFAVRTPFQFYSTSK